MSGFEDLFRRAEFDSSLPFITPLTKAAQGRAAKPEVEAAISRGDVASEWAAAVNWQVPPGATAAVAQSLNRTQRAASEDFNDHNDDITGLQVQVGVPATAVVSCCRCPAHLEVAFLGYGDMVRRIEAAGWHVRPSRRLSDWLWCRECRETGRADR
jgi:hypothetical protein